MYWKQMNSPALLQMQSEFNVEHLNPGQNLDQTMNYLENAMTGKMNLYGLLVRKVPSDRPHT
ncbi:MAG: hypothetical protein VB996_07725 [Pseudomonadales bacterium]